MVQGYYTLQEAAQFLGMGPDDLKQLAQKKGIRSFQDRGTLRFRIQDVQELSRRRGANSDPDLIVGSAPPTTPKAAPKSDSGPRSPSKPAVSGDVFEFSLDIDDKVDIGQEILVDLPGGPKKSGAKPPGSSPGRPSSQRSPIPKSGSDSDVRLVGGDDHAGSDSDVKVVGQDSDVKLPEIGTKTPQVPRKSGPGSISPTPQKSPRPSVPQPDSSPQKRLAGAAQPADSGVRLVPIDSDSDVKIVGAGSDEVPLGDASPPSASDSDIRLEKYAQPAAGSQEGAMHLTEEINLDEEIRKQEAALQQPQAKLKRKSKLQLPTTSPFELSESDIKTGAKPVPKAGSKAAPKDAGVSKEDSSDFNLSPAADSSASSLSGSDDFSLELPDDSALGAEMSALSGPTSGISLENPVDAGISLEEGPEASDIDFDLSLEVEATPRPAAAAPAVADSDSEFELSLDAEDSGQQPAAPGVADSDSEFELTLDDSGGLSSLDSDDAPAPQVKGDSDEKDIFETDFEVPALEDESGSQVASLETDLDSSDFDIALDDSGVENESQSQVVALDEEADEAATTRATDDEGIEVEVEGEEGGFGGLEVEEEGDALDAKTVVKEKLIQPAPWGALPVVFMLPCVIVMVLVGLLGFELVQSAGGYKAPGFLTKAISEMIGQKIK